MKIFLFIILSSLSLFANQRLITLSPALNEIVFTLGKGDKIVGNTTYCVFPTQSKNISKVGGYFSPSLEKILALQPTLVIMQQNNYKLSKKLSQLGIKTYITKIDTLKNIQQTIQTLGTLLNAQQQADRILLSLKKRLFQLQGIVSNKKILIVIGQNTSLASQIFVAGQNLYFDDIIKASGNTNAFQSKRKGQPILNMENIIATNADIVIILAPFLKQSKLTKKQLIQPWKKLPINAAKKNNIFVISKEYAGIPSDRINLFLEDFRGILDASH